jgi:Cof subfamily protein (haloacid dehalogenase superfamily)
MTDSIQLVVVDLDGTLLNAEHVVTEQAEQAIRAAREQGIKVMLATGKTRSSALKVIEQLKLDTPGIFVQGFVVHDADGSIRHQVTLDPAIARQVITFAEDRGFSLIAYSGTTTYIRARNYNTNLVVEYGEPESQVVGPLQNILDTTRINKLAIIDRSDPRRVKAVRWQLNMQLNGSARLVQPAVSEMVEVLPKGGSKGTALKAILKDLHLSPSQVMAIGDGENDIEMLQFAGTGVAVANAEPILKSVAGHVTTASYGDGVAEAIERFVLKAETQPNEPESQPTAEREVESS